jgi:Ca-activated chloride channel family protein
VDFIPQNFHFLRPLWLLALIPAVMLFLAIRHSRTRASRWDNAIDTSLLPYLLDGEPGKRHRWPLLILLSAWLLTSLNLAGPVWKKLPQPVQKKTDALVIIQDLSLSFFAQDLSPNRLTRTRHKLHDILQSRKEGTTALIVYSGDAHVVAPLTDDTNTIAAMVPDLSPEIMPSFGSNLPAAVTLALRLFKDGLVASGKILLLTDEVDKEDVSKVARLLSGKNIVLSVLGVGTEDGGPIPKSDGGFWKDEQDKIIVPRLPRTVLQDLAQKTGGRYSDLKLDDSDFNYLLAAKSLIGPEDQYRQIDREFDQWQEHGHWLVLLLLPFALLAFRRGWIIGLLVILSLSGNEAQAMTWQDLWLRPDQQGTRALAENAPQKAAELFKSPQWKGVAEFQAGNYEGAAAAFNELSSDDGNYNLGNALAKKGELKEALQAYDKALQLNPEQADASFNRELVEKLLQQQEQQKEQDKEQKQKSDDQQQSQKNSAQGQDQPSAEHKSQDKAQDHQGKDQAGETADRQDEAGRDDEHKNTDPDKVKKQGQQDDKDEQSGKDQDRAVGQPAEESADKQNPGEEARMPEDKLSAEEQQALEQWLRKIPDNPGGFLKRKFEYQSRRNPDRNPQHKTKIW